MSMNVLISSPSSYYVAYHHRKICGAIISFLTKQQSPTPVRLLLVLPTNRICRKTNFMQNIVSTYNGWFSISKKRVMIIVHNGYNNELLRDSRA